MESSKAKILANFVDFCCQALDISHKPEIFVTENQAWARTRHSFGEYNASIPSVTVYINGRNIADVLRTLAHELVHHRQNELGMIKPGSGETGSDIENQANAMAGILMREYGRMNKIIYESKKIITYTKPNLEYEWEEAIRYPEFLKIGKKNWIKLANNGYDISFSKIQNNLGNVDLDFTFLEDDKKARFEKAYKSGIIEYPIVVKFSDYDYDLVSGNTRVAGLVSKGIDPKLWVIDISS